MFVVRITCSPGVVEMLTQILFNLVIYVTVQIG